MPPPPPDDLSHTIRAGQPPPKGVPLAPASTLTQTGFQPGQLSVPDWLWVFRCDQRRRWRSGERILVEAYLQQQPVLKTQPFALLDLVEAEVSLREELGELPGAEEYGQRFPDLTASLQRLFALRRALKSGSLPVPPITAGSTDTTLVPPEEQAAAWAAAARTAATRQSVPGYEIMEELGRGGMGVVYKARQLGLNRLVALKMILAGVHAGQAERDRFHREAEAVAKLQHANIVQVHEVAEHQGRPFFSLELVEGGNLAQHLKGTPLAVLKAAELGEKLARAMHYAHQRGVIHRDLKPPNVLLTLEGEPKITDFGLAKQLEATGNQTQSGAILGTPSYMAPEQAWGKTQWVGPPADVYALGAILYEMLVGRPPFKAETPLDTISQVVNDEPVPPTRLQPRVPADIENICLKCLRKDPVRRYGSAEALADDLRRFRNGEPVLARPVGKGERFRRWCRRNPALATASGLASLALVAITLISVSFAIHESQSAQKLQQEKDRTEQALKNLKERTAQLDRERTLAEKRKRLSVRVGLDDGLDLCEQGEVGRGLLWLTSTLSLTNPETQELRGTIRSNLGGWFRQLHALKAVLPQDSAVMAAALFPDGKMMAMATAAHEVRLLVIATGKTQTLAVPRSIGALALAVRPDGKQLLLGCNDGTVRLWDLAADKPASLLLKLSAAVRAVAFSADSKKILTGTVDGKVHIWEAGEGKLLFTFQHQKEVTAAALSPDGTKVATASLDRTARLWDALTGLPVGPVLDHPDAVLALAFSPDGRNLVTGCRDHTARLWTVATGKAYNHTFPHQEAVTAVAYSPDGRSVLTGSADGVARLWEEATGRTLGSSLPHPAAVQLVAFNPDGRTILTGCADRAVRLWELASGKGVRPPLVHPGGIEALAVSPDGRTLLTGGSDYTARLWDLATGKPIGAPLTHREVVFVVGYSPDGKILATGGKDNQIQLWDAATLTPLGKPLLHKGIVWAIAFTPDSSLILTASGDKTARVWDTATGQPVGGPIQQPDEIIGAALRPDGKVIALGGLDCAVSFWSLDTRKPWGVSLSHPGPVWSLAFSPDGKKLLTGCADNNARLWELPSGKLLGTFAHQDKVRQVAFNSDGKTFLTASLDRTARLWDAATGKPLGQPLRHRLKVNAVAFHPKGNWVVTGSADGTARVWETALPLEGEPEQLLLLAQVATGLELDPARMLAAISGRKADAAAAIQVLDAAAWKNRFDRLQKTADLARRLPPLVKSARAWHEREAASCEAAGQWYAARWHLDGLLREKPAGTLYARRADASFQLGEWDQTITDGTRALDHQQAGNWEVWYRLARAYGKKNRDAPALANYRKAAELAPEDGALRLLCSLEETRLGQDAKAEEDYAQAAVRSQGVYLADDRFWWERERGLPPYRRKVWAEILSELNLLPAATISGTRLLGRGLTQAAHAEWAKAAADFEKAAQLHPSDGHSHWGVARAQAELNQTDKALAACTLALKNLGKEWSLWFLRASLYYNANRNLEAVLDMHEALALHRRGAALWGLRGGGLEQLGEYTAAIPDFSKGLEERTDYAWLWAHRGYAYYQTNMNRKAIADLTRAAQMDVQTFYWVLNYRGLCRLREDERELALADFQESFRLNPQYDTAAFNLGNTFFQGGEYARAAAAYAQAIQANPRTAGYFKSRARCYIRLGTWDKAGPDLERALELAPTQGGWWLQKYLVQVRSGQASKADDAFAKALLHSQAVYPPADRRWTLRPRGALATERPGWEEVLADLDREPKTEAWYYRARGLARAALARWQDAAADLEKAAALNPEDGSSLAGAARAHVEQNQWTQAAEWCGKALARKADSWELSYLRGIISFNQGKYPEAAEAFTRATQHGPRNWVAWAALGETREKQRQWEPAVVAYSRAIDLDRDNAWLYFQRASLYSLQADNDKALADYTRAIQADGRYAAAYNNRGLLYFTRKQYDLALADFNQALLYEPNSADYHDNRGMTYFRQNQVGAALADYTRALQINPRHFWTFVDRGLLFSAQGKYEEAIADYTQAIAISAVNFTPFKNRGYAQARLGRWDKAIADYEKSVSLKPDDLGSWTSLAALHLQENDRAAYRKTCVGMFKQFGGTKDPATAFDMLWFCVLVPDCGVEPTRLVELGQKSLAGGPNNANYVGTLGAALYRAGRFKEAAETLDRAITLHGKGGLALDWLFLAMTYQKRENKDDARKWLEKARKWIEENVEKPPRDKPPLLWNTLLQWRLLRKEAESLISSEEKPKK